MRSESRLPNDTMKWWKRRGVINERGWSSVNGEGRGGREKTDGRSE